MFHDLFSWEYMDIGSYKRLQGVIKGYKELQKLFSSWKSFVRDLFSRSITWEYMGIQGVTRGYKGTNPFGKILILRFS